MLLRSAESADIANIKKLYIQSFPAEERKSFGTLTRLFKKGRVGFWVIAREDNFAGMMITAEKNGVTLLDYFAVEPSERGKGTGSAALALLREQCPVIALEIESPDVECENKSVRASRKKFYLRNGYEDSGIRMKIYGNYMELLTIGGKVGFEDYCEVFRKASGRISGIFIKHKRLD